MTDKKQTMDTYAGAGGSTATGGNITITGGCAPVEEKKSCELWINTNLRVTFYVPMPNRFIRFWHKFLLGWEWHNLEQS